ncbi:hypothetical protein ONK29_27590, partial [Salmonella enterica subsp. enterica serovar Anatum]|nr:hypothetical protein [Salmonella enterica subsp. enterica serovar Anatum]
KPFFTSLKKYTDISYVQFYNCYHDRHIGAYTGIETVKWFIRKLVLPLRLRLKILIRPTGLKAPTEAEEKKLRFIAKENTIRI